VKVPPPSASTAGLPALDPRNVLAQDGGFDPAEFGLAALLENLGDGGLLGAFDLFVGIEKNSSPAGGPAVVQ